MLHNPVGGSSLFLIDNQWLNPSTYPALGPKRSSDAPPWLVDEAPGFWKQQRPGSGDFRTMQWRCGTIFLPSYPRPLQFRFTLAALELMPCQGKLGTEQTRQSVLRNPRCGCPQTWAVRLRIPVDPYRHRMVHPGRHPRREIQGTYKRPSSPFSLSIFRSVSTSTSQTRISFSVWRPQWLRNCFSLPPWRPPLWRLPSLRSVKAAVQFGKKPILV